VICDLFLNDKKSIATNHFYPRTIQMDSVLIRDEIRSELELEIDNINSWQNWDYADEDRLVSLCTQSGMLVFRGRLGNTDVYPKFVQNLIDDVRPTEEHVGTKRMQSRTEVKIVGFEHVYTKLADIVRYTNPKLFPNLVGVCCKNIIIKNDEEYRSFQKLASRLKYLVCDGTIEYLIASDNVFEPYQQVSYTGPKVIRFENVRYASFYSGFAKENKFKLDLPNCKLIVVNTTLNTFSQFLFPLEIVPNKSNKYFELLHDSSCYNGPGVNDVKLWAGMLKGFDHVENASFRSKINCPVPHIMKDVFAPMGKLKTFSYIIDNMDVHDDELSGVFRSCEDILDFILLKINLEEVMLRYGKNYSYKQYLFNMEFPRLVFTPPHNQPRNELTRKCEELCVEVTKRIIIDVLSKASSTADVPRSEVKPGELRARPLEELFGSLTVTQKELVRVSKPANIPLDVITDHILSYLFPKG
jgi:hypothetical protein